MKNALWSVVGYIAVGALVISAPVWFPVAVFLEKRDVRRKRKQLSTFVIERAHQ